MASGLRRLPVGRLPRVQTPPALPTQQLRTPVQFALPANPPLPNPVAFPLPANPPLPNPVSIPLPTGITGTPPPPSAGGGSGGVASGDRLDLSAQGVGFWTIGAKSAKSSFRIFSPHVHNWNGE